MILMVMKFFSIDPDTLKQHFVSLGWVECTYINYRGDSKPKTWFKKGELRTCEFVGSSEISPITIYNTVSATTPAVSIFEVYPQRFSTEGGTTDVGVGLVRWIKEVEGKWGLYKL